MAFIVLLGASCDRSEPFIGDIAGADTGAFKVYAAGESDLSKGLPKTCILPEEPETKTTSVPMNALASQLLEYGNRGKVLELFREDVPEDVIFAAELVDMEVFADDTCIGKITEVLDYPGNSVYVVQGEREYLIPAVKEFILSTDLEKNEMQVKLLEGMASDED